MGDGTLRSSPTPSSSTVHGISSFCQYYGLRATTQPNPALHTNYTTVYERPHSPTRRFTLTISINRAGRRTTFIATFLTLSTVHARLAPQGLGSACSP